MAKKPKVAIYDFTDCEGCEVEIISLREKLLQIENKVQIVNWRLEQEYCEQGLYDITVINGLPMTKYEINLLKELRKNSKILIALGTCAALGGIPALMPDSDRQKWYNKIYGKKYKPISISAKPLSAYVNIDFAIHGCPVDKDEIIRIFEEIIFNKEPKYNQYPVCFECKTAGNRCRLLENKPCLGPITQGGCKAICVSGDSSCYGCFGLRRDANINGLVKILEKIYLKKEMKNYLKMFINMRIRII